jgi:RsiW-degrading membrane proteinase PrsW (M82 family)
MANILILYGILLILLAFIPSLLFVRWFRNLEKYSREPYKTIFSTFMWGAFLAVFFAAIIEYALFSVLTYEYELIRVLPLSTFIILAIVIAPLAEEFIKPLGIIFRARAQTDEVEDGMIYGAVIGLGFAATENLMYGISTLATEDIATASLVIGVRSISSTLLHASATAITGYGIGLYLVKKKPFRVIIPYFFYAVLLHALFNAIAVTNTVLGLIFAIAIAILATDFVKRKIIELDLRRQHIETVQHVMK